MPPSGAEPWRKTGRRATAEHFLGLDSGIIVEAPAYSDTGVQQGHLLLVVSATAAEDCAEGRMYMCHFLAVQDEYFLWWLN
jgi:hypothetical protein